MLIEKTISSTALMANLYHILAEIRCEGNVYFVKIDEPNWQGDMHFVLGPESICGRVLGLVDPEYGWPEQVEIDKIKGIWDLSPGYRRHPFICRGNVCYAVGIKVGEYEDIKQRFFTASD